MDGLQYDDDDHPEEEGEADKGESLVSESKASPASQGSTSMINGKEWTVFWKRVRGVTETVGVIWTEDPN